MEIPRYWQKTQQQIRHPDGRWVQLKAWGWSADHDAAALAMAKTRLKSLVARVTSGEALPRRYEYGSRPLREEILEEISDSTGTPHAVITRNSYGSRVLNTARMLFIDVDVTPLGLWARFRRALVRRADRKPAPELQRLRDTLTRLKAVSFRIYETAAGFRAMAVSQPFEPDSEATNAILQAAGADPAFTHLCRLQKSFRARLTPKSWRCGLPDDPPPYPREDVSSEETFKTWLDRYEAESRGWATCRYLETTGSGQVHDDLATLLDIHDTHTRVGEPLELA